MDLVEFWEREVLPQLRVETIYEGIEWKARGPRFWRGPCPLHGGSDANFSVDSHTLRWRCFSQCGGGSLFAFLNNGVEPRGEKWVATLRELARYTGVAFPDRELAPEAAARLEEITRQQSLLEAFATICQSALLDSSNAAAQPTRAYLLKRGFAESSWSELPFGWVAPRATLQNALRKRGFADDEIAASGVLRDGRFENRLLIVWRDSRGRIGTFAARDVSDKSDEKYLYLSRENGFAQAKNQLLAFGLDGALPAIARNGELLLVEGLLDVLTLQNRGFEGVAAIGGNGREFGLERLAGLQNLGVRHLTLCLDNDPQLDGSWPGREGSLHIARLVTLKDNVRNVRNDNVNYITDVVPIVDIVPPFLLGSSKDADAYVQSRGIAEFRELLRERQSAALWLGNEVLEGVTPTSSSSERRAGIERIVELDAALCGPRAPLDREELRALCARQTGFSTEAIAQIADEITEHNSQKQRKRALKSWLQKAAREVSDDSGEGIETLTARLASEVGGLRGITRTLPLPFSVARLEEESRRQPVGKTSGWPSLDALGVRFGAGEFALVGARTGHGKTSFLVALMAQWLSLGEDETLLFFSLEESELRIYHRLLALFSAHEAARSPRHVEAWTVPQVRDFGRDPTMRGDGYGWPDIRSLEHAREKLRAAQGRLQIVFQSGWSIHEIENYARLCAQRKRVGAIFVDYLQRVPAPEGRFDRRDQEVSAVGRRLKALAGDVEAPVLAGAQINREAIPEGFSKQMNAAKTYGEAQKQIRNARPELHHLREGGSEQEADLTLGLLSYGADYRGEMSAPVATKMEVGTLKNRNGEPGKWAALAFEGRSGLVREVADSEEI